MSTEVEGLDAKRADIASPKMRVVVWLAELAHEWRTRRVSPHWILVLGLALMTVQLVRDYRANSPAEDELTHMVRGIAYWQQADPRLSYGHPPLGNALMALPVAFAPDNPRIDELKGWASANAGSVTTAYAKEDFGRARNQLMKARLGAMAFGLLLAVYLFYFCLSVFGPGTAFVALVLVVFNPVVLGQSRFVGTDGPAALGFALGVGELIRYLRGAKYSAVLAPLAVGVGLLCKYSCLLLVPLAAVTTVAAAFFGWGRFSSLPPKKRGITLLAHAVLGAAIVLFVINGAYRFRDTGLTVHEIAQRPEPQYWVSAKHKETLVERFTPIAQLPDGLIVPLPYTYVFGIAGMRGHMKAGFTSFFWGERIRKAPVVYYPTMLAIKNPPALLLLLATGIIALLKLRRLSMPSAVLLVASGAFVALAARSGLAMGVRHLLPAIPLLCVLAARAFERAWTLASRSHVRYALGALLATSGVSALFAARCYLGYFNIFAGGRERGHEISIYGEDWGQDRARLAKFVKKHRIEPLYYHEQTPIRAMEARFHGFPYQPLQCKTEVENAWVAIHALVLRTEPNDSKCFAFLKGMTPLHKINDHIYLYRIPARS